VPKASLIETNGASSSPERDRKLSAATCRPPEAACRPFRPRGHGAGVNLRTGRLYLRSMGRRSMDAHRHALVVHVPVKIGLRFSMKAERPSA
jgi:hypothetical protein